MRVDRIALRGFLSHQSTDWVPGGRLVSLVGPNGAGKSSLLDAIAYALFDGARGRTDDLVQLGATDMSATIEFLYSGSRYRVTRGRTTRSGGRSYLELAVCDGDTWRPLTAPSIRETQALLEQLLRLDADTFATAVLLGQGRADRFAAATAAERKRILGQVLGLEVYEAAEAEARGRARTTAATITVHREQAEREERTAASLEEHRADLARVTEAAAEVGARIAEATDRRDQAQRRLEELAGELAAIAAIEADAARLEHDVREAQGRWRLAAADEVAATEAMARHEGTLARASLVEAAAAAIPGHRERIAVAEAEQRKRAIAEDALRDAREALRRESAAHEAVIADHDRERHQLEHAVATLEAHVSGLSDVTCPDCGRRFAADPSGMASKLRAARDLLAAFPAPPREPMVLDRAKAAVTRAEIHVRELPEPIDLPALRAELAGMERQAGAAGEMGQARDGLAEAARRLAVAQAAKAAAEEAGRAAAAAYQAARARVASAGGLRAEQADERVVIEGADLALRSLEEQRTEATGAIARLGARIEECEQAAAHAIEVQGVIDALAQEQRRLDRLVGAFGVKGIPARIIESVLPELARHANALLEQLRPGMVLELRAQRAARSGDGVVEALDLVVRDDVGERPLAMFSGGERMSVSLAIAAGLSRLVARRAGTAIRTLVVDEPDGLDADARRSFGQALRTLAHQGELERVIVVSHHEDLAEASDSVYRVTRGRRGSVVELAA